MNNTIQNIIVIGAGYVGLSNAILLSQHHLETNVKLLDINTQKIEQLQQRQSPVQDDLIEQYLINQPLNITFQLIEEANFSLADLIIIATPTNYDMTTGQFDTSSIEWCVSTIQKHNRNVPIVIKSTIPIGFTKKLQENTHNPLLFMPEFLREGQALYDNLYPSRIIIGSNINNPINQPLIALYQQASILKNVNICQMPTTEAEAVKLFANSYLATRVAFFNELDSFAESWGLDSKSIILGVGLDPRIGTHYNNPSFGYGGYCLPKDTKQLQANFQEVPANIIHAVIDANHTRKHFIAQQILSKNVQKIGIYRLSMKKDADNFRDSAILDIIKILQQYNLSIQIFEPSLKQSTFLSHRIETNLEKFLTENDLIIANRWHNDLLAVQEKVYSRDIFGDN